MSWKYNSCYEQSEVEELWQQAHWRTAGDQYSRKLHYYCTYGKILTAKEGYEITDHILCGPTKDEESVHVLCYIY